ncbi:MAG: thiosulfate reductase cytochrome subunit [Caulobacteraceae bacterium]|nr:thiosulfate reductase cytochrome subunit [Caulobacteraceae bacterium]
MSSVPDTTIPAPFKPAVAPGKAGVAIYRHRLATRIGHWINVLCLTVLLMSGAQIFNAHPRLYWGQYGANADPAVLAMAAVEGPNGAAVGVTQVGPWTFRTTGVFGLSKERGQITERGFPAWLTLPSYQDLATGRHWHFFFAWLLVVNGLVYLIHTVLSGHLKRDLLPRKDELRPRHLGQDIWDHLRLRQPVGEAATRYNTLQKISYLAVIFVLLPLMLLTGLTLSPGMDAVLPVLLDVFGGRQSARTLHFITANLIVLFVVVHLAEVLISGPWNEVRSMITGWYVARTGKAGGETPS